jgi:hypothetical protein
LSFKKGIKVLDGVETLELHGERMFGQCDASPFLISLQCRLEKRLKVRGYKLVGHLKCKEEMRALGGLAVRK